MPQKFLIIRFSAIGDVVLTTPIIRSLRKAFPDSEIHFLTKASNKDVLLHNPYITRLHLLKDDLKSCIESLKAIKFDFILDLHHNLRSARVKSALKVKSQAFPKENLNKWLLCQPAFRRFAKPIPHVVDRYGEALRPLGLSLDEDGLDVFLPEELEKWAYEHCLGAFGDKKKPIAIVLGGTYFTKRWLTENFAPLINALPEPVVLIGGPDMVEEARMIEKDTHVPMLNTVGEYGLLESAALMKQCNLVVSHDTGFMHIAAAFKQKIISIWGNTVPEFGMTPYRTSYELVEVKDLACRPCSKLGYDQCPKGHFTCMKGTSPQHILSKME